MRELSFNLGLPSAATSSIQDPEVSAEMYKIYNAINNLALKLDEYTGGLTVSPPDRPYTPSSLANRSKYVNRGYILAPSALAAKTVVNVYAGGVRAALHSSQPAHAIVLEDTAANDYAPIALQGVIDGFVGLTVGAPYYLSSGTPGAITATAGTQKIGFALTSTALAFGFLI